MSLYSREYSFNTYNEVFKDSAGSFKSLPKTFLLCMGTERVLRHRRHPAALAWAAVPWGLPRRRVPVGGPRQGWRKGRGQVRSPRPRGQRALQQGSSQACSERAAAGQMQEILTVFSLVLSFLPKV